MKLRAHPLGKDQELRCSKAAEMMMMIKIMQGILFSLILTASGEGCLEEVSPVLYWGFASSRAAWICLYQILGGKNKHPRTNKTPKQNLTNPRQTNEKTKQDKTLKNPNNKQQFFSVDSQKCIALVSSLDVFYFTGQT